MAVPRPVPLCYHAVRRAVNGLTGEKDVSQPTTDVPAGRYRHYKGNLYEVLGVARHSETQEELVVYRALYGAGGLWVRPRAMFLEEVIVGGQAVPRFRFVGPAS